MNDKSETISTLLADDHPVVRAGIRAILEHATDITVVGEASDGREARNMAIRLRPHVLLLDLHMPGPRPTDTVSWLQAHCPETAVLVLTAHDIDAYLAAMIAAGVAGFVVKEEAPETVVEAVRRAARGEALFSREQLARVQRWHKEVGETWGSLTGRERRVLQLLAQGLENDAIAEALCVPLKTVDYHLANLLSKLGVSSRLEAVVWAHNHLHKAVRNC
mgnify:CR=1 FL=1